MAVAFSIPSISDFYAYIKNTALGAPAANIDIQNIPQTYHDLMMRIKYRCDNAALVNVTGVFVNNDTTVGNYKTNSHQMTGSTPIGSNASANPQGAALPQAPGSTALANQWGIVELYIAEYSDTNRFKFIHANGNVVVGNTLGDVFWWDIMITHLANNAIDRITFTPAGAANFIAGCEYSLFLLGKK